MFKSQKFQKKSTLLLCGIFILLLNMLLFSVLILQKANGSPQKSENTVQVYPEIASLSMKNMSFQELTDYFTDLSHKKSAQYAYEILKMAPMPPNTDMHLLAHAVGDILYKQQGVNGIKFCTDDFRNACSHSIVVALFRRDGLQAINLISKVCQDAPGSKSAYTMCFHGLGHGILAYTDYNLEKAIDLCRYTGTKEWRNAEYIECSGGAVMEMMSGVHDPDVWEAQKKLYFRENDPLYPCSSDFIPNEAKPICYIYLTPHLFEYVGTNMSRAPTEKNYTDAFRLCNKLPLSETIYRDACYGGFGKEFIVIAHDGDIRKIDQMNPKQLKKVYDWCSLADTQDGTLSCIQYALGSLLWGGENTYKAGIQFCSLVIDNDHKNICYNSLLDLIAKINYPSEDQQVICKTLPKDFLIECSEKLNSTSQL